MMQRIALGLTAALAVGAALAATPASAGVIVEYNSGPARFYRPPPPPIYRPAPVVYRAAPVRVCTVSFVREWGLFGPHMRRFETCRNRY